ncbi:ABC transporter substrate-binding protein [Microbacterium elymi]|uniref:ABC transporter substrate-binding protein n=1 Tax=Microbacterium elymi TaxID=2909587 RepID=A0ABY5NM13_9MICO|nr:MULTISPECIES: ABC transporter substrate-binding protein [Microbacterium]UUT36182.1 ABC transporter substrate-binding protein [Microbacterium elymi]
MVQRRITRTATLLAGAAALGMLLAGCAAPGQNKGAAESGGTGPIKVAIVNAQSGQLSSLGDWEYKGVKMAFDELNDAGGIDGRQIKYTLYDDQGDPTVSTNLARKVAGDGNIAMMGTAESADALAMAPIMAENKIPMITSGQSPKLGELHNPFVFLNSPPSTAFDETLAKYLVTTKGYKNIAMISNNGAYGAGEHDAFLASLKALGVSPSADQVVTPDQKDFSSALTRIRDAKPDVLFTGTEEVETGLIVKQARQLGIDAIIAGGAPAGTPVYVKTAGTANAEGTIVSTPYLGNDTNEKTKKFAADYKAKYNEDGEFHGAKAYDGAQILIQALKKSNVATGQKLSDAIRSITYDGLVGHFAFDANGIGVHETQIGKIDASGNLVPAS